MPANREVAAGRFRLLSPIGEGSTSEVHRAEDLHAQESSSDRLVVLKLILPNAGAETAEHFDREMRIMRRLNHPNLARTIAGSADSDVTYLAVEFLDGHTLDRLGRTRLPIPWVAALGAQIANGLSAAHSAGVVHRDLKPSNVMVLRGGVVKVLDFGMGRIVESGRGTGMTVDAARYLAPEQFGSSAVFQAADLYSLGCVLFELLTGVPPFRGGTPFELGHKHRHETLPPLRPLRPDLPDGMARLVESLLAKRPVDRPVDAVAVREALLPFAVADDPVPGWEHLNPVSWLAETHAAKPVGPEREVQASDVDSPAAFVEADLDAELSVPGDTVLDLAGTGVLHRECSRIFQVDKTAGGNVCDGRPLPLHQHQREAIDIAQSGESYVLTTDPGASESLSYLVPIVDKVLKDRATAEPDARKRIRAIIVHPVNAPASELGELDKYLLDGYNAGREPVTFTHCTGRDGDERREEIHANPPDILLTDPVMLELMLTRPGDRGSPMELAEGLEFLVLDDLHTYRGRRGSDVALLIRRIREACRAERMQCIGTSAAMSVEGTGEDRREIVARVASALFGTAVDPRNVIGETSTPTSETSSRRSAPAVAPPRHELGGEALMRSHLQAIWLAESRLELGRTMPEVIDIGDARRPDPELPLRDHIAAALHTPEALGRAVAAARQVFDGLLEELLNTDWWHDQWIEDAVLDAGIRFDLAFKPWRDLFRTALLEKDSPDSHPVLADFNPYHYLMNVGFLPGYALPYLPLAADHPDERGGVCLLTERCSRYA
ncbi:protein kinase domain-containing protein [Saccharopolyspora spinosa]|uniref:non-specific serine/threonine protein kinase n=1 Tax=Saccharopolyspora spinosa TaxID=60894 RepID=A0A2N3Y4H3_SACSN|nr:protein kinase [Saccharopolyspora spinosa]PKW17783.1 RAD3-like DEAD/DEAH box helicase [Saccharopolyspora spinosa]